MGINVNAKFEEADRVVRANFATALAKKEYQPKAAALFEEIDSEDLSEDYNWMLDTFGFRRLKENLPIKVATEKRVTIQNEPWVDNLTVDLRVMKTRQSAKYKLQASMKGRQVGRFLDNRAGALLALNGKAFTENSWDGVPFFSDVHPISGNTTHSNYDNAGGNNPWFLFDTSVIHPMIVQWLEKPYEEAFGPETEWSKNNRKVKWDFHLDMGIGMTLWWFAYASRQTLDEAHFAAAQTKMMQVPTYELLEEQTQYLGVMPNLLVVGASNKLAAEKLLNASNKANGESNVLYKNVDLLVLPTLP